MRSDCGRAQNSCWSLASFAVNGAANAAILAVQMLALADPALQQALATYKQEMADTVAAKDAKLQQEF